MPEFSSSPPASSGTPNLQTSPSPDPESLLEEYGLEDYQVLRQVLKEFGEDSSPDEETIRTYLSEKKKGRGSEPVLREIQSEEAAEVSASLVRREMRETAARLRLQKAQDAFERARQEKEAASQHLLRVLHRTGDLPADKNWGVNAARGTVHELPFDARGTLLELALQLFKMEAAELALIEENKGELFPDPIEEGLHQIEEESPALEAREFLADLAAAVSQFEEPGRKFILAVLNRPEGARSIAEAEDLPKPLRFLAQLCVG